MWPARSFLPWWLHFNILPNITGAEAKWILSIKFTTTQNFQMPTVFTNLPKCGTTWNDLKWPEATWNNLQRARNDLKWPTVIKKWPETTYKQGTTRNNLQRTHSNFMEPLYLKNNRLEDSQFHKEAIDHLGVLYCYWNLVRATIRQITPLFTISFSYIYLH